jgi:hypothetical protein
MRVSQIGIALARHPAASQSPGERQAQQRCHLVAEIPARPTFYGRQELSWRRLPIRIVEKMIVSTKHELAVRLTNPTLPRLIPLHHELVGADCNFACDGRV